MSLFSYAYVVSYTRHVLICWDFIHSECLHVTVWGVHIPGVEASPLPPPVDERDGSPNKFEGGDDERGEFSDSNSAKTLTHFSLV